MKIEQVDLMHRIGRFKRDNGNRKSRPIRVIDVTFLSIKVLKGKNISITESLTKERMRKLRGKGAAWF